MSKENEIVVKQTNTLQIDDSMIEALKHRYEMFVKLQKEVLEEGTDYGYPAGQKPDQKPSLYKSGAEKLSQLFGLIPEFIELKAIEDKSFVMYKFRCELRAQDGRVVGIGYGVATSDEKTHWKQNPLGNANTIIKIAKKRSHVDAVLNGLGASNVFTQDLEDYEPGQIDNTQAVIQPKHSVTKPTETTQPANKQNTALPRNEHVVEAKSEDIPLDLEKQPTQKQKNFLAQLMRETAKRKNIPINEEVRWAETIRGKKANEWTAKDFSNMIILYKVLKVASKDLQKILIESLLEMPSFLDEIVRDLENHTKGLYSEEELIEIIRGKQINLLPTDDTIDDTFNEEPPF